MPSPGGSGPKGATPASPVAASARAGERLEIPRPERGGPAGAATLERAEEILRQIRLAIQPHAKRVVLELAPDDLGRLSIRMTLRRGELATVVRVESPETLRLLEQRSTELRALLAERGFDARELAFEPGFGAERHDFRGGSGQGAGSFADERPRAGALHDRRRADPLPTPCFRSDGVDTYA